MFFDGPYEGDLPGPPDYQPTEPEPTAKRSHFTAEEAAALLGRRYVATGGYAGVPAGTVGQVRDPYPVGGGLFGVDVVWELPPTGSPADQRAGGRVDGFSRRDLYLRFTAGPLEGRLAMEPLDAEEPDCHLLQELRDLAAHTDPPSIDVDELTVRLMAEYRRRHPGLH